MGVLLPDMHNRVNIPELMDDPDSDCVKLIRTVRQFKIINLLFSRSRKLIRKYIFPCLSPGREEPYRFLDVGAGGCDIALWIHAYCRKKGIPVEITCLDYDPRIAEYAEQVTDDISQIRVAKKSVFELDETQIYDFTFSNHFLHHFSDDQVGEILKKISRLTKRVLLMNDLCRSKATYIAYRLFSVLFLHNSFAAYDGSVSIRRGFSRKEMIDIVSASGIADTVEIEKVFPGRIIVLLVPSDSSKRL